MQKILASLIIVILFPVVVVANDLNFTLYSKIMSKYVASNSFVPCNKPPVQTGLTTSFENGFWADIWLSYPLDGQMSFCREFDVTVGYKTKLWKHYDLNVGILYINLLPKTVGDIVDPFLKISRSFDISENHRLSPYLQMDLYFPLAKNSPPRGLHTSIGIVHNWKINELFSLNNDLTIKHDNGALGFKPGVIGKIGTNLSWALNKNLSLQLPIVNATAPLHHIGDGRKSEIAVGAGFTYQVSFKLF